MASLGICCGGDRLFGTVFRKPHHITPGFQNARPSSCLIAGKTGFQPRRCRISASHSNHSYLSLYGDHHQEGKNTEATAYEKLDGWMRHSVKDIVKNLGEAPLLVQVYEGKRLQTERALPEDWDELKSKWENREAPLPDGIIFVEELRDDTESEDEQRGITTAWGIVVQGKGKNPGPACYLLKTSRVRCGVGLSCTHFCLMKVKSFRKDAKEQLKDCWLLQGM